MEVPLEDCVMASFALTTDKQPELGGMNPSVQLASHTSTQKCIYLTLQWAGIMQLL